MTDVGGAYVLYASEPGGAEGGFTRQADLNYRPRKPGQAMLRIKCGKVWSRGAEQND